MIKKILFIITQSEFGGAQHFLAHLTAALDKNKYDILVAAGPEGDDGAGLLYFLEKRGINTRHLKYLRRGVNPLFDFLGLIEIRKLIKKEKPDILFLCSSKAGAIGSLAGRLAGVNKIIYRIGGWTFNDPRPKQEKIFYKFIEKCSARWKDIIIVNSEHDRKQAIDLKIRPKSGIITIYNGIDINKLAFLSSEQARDEFSKLTHNSSFLISDTIVIGTIANFYPAKGLNYLVESANLLIKNYPTLLFVIIGEGQQRKNLRLSIKKYNLENNFFLLGAISDAHRHLKGFNIFVLPSLKEGFPWTILEAMAAEVPIVVTKVGVIPEIVENQKTGIVIEPGNVEEMSYAITTLISNPVLKGEIAKNARQLIEERFSLDKMVKEVDRILS